MEPRNTRHMCSPMAFLACVDTEKYISGNFTSRTISFERCNWRPGAYRAADNVQMFVDKADIGVTCQSFVYLCIPISADIPYSSSSVHSAKNHPLTLVLCKKIACVELVSHFTLFASKVL